MVSKETINKLLQAIHVPAWLVGILAFVVVLRIPSFFEPYSYGDEMIYLTLGEGIRQGIPLYSGLHDNKPPLLYLLAAVSNRLFWFKAMLAFWNLATIILFWKLIQGLYPKKVTLQKISTAIFAVLTTIPLLEGNIVNAEMFMVGLTILAFLILLTKKLTAKSLILAGMLFGLAALFKIPAAFELPVILLYWLITSGLKLTALKNTVKNFGYVVLGFVIPLAITFIWYGLKGTLGQYLYAAFLQNFGYLSTWRPADQNLPFLVKNAPLLIRGGVVLLGIAVLFWRRKSLPREFVFICLWLLLALFGVTLSERPYPHYLIQVVPTVSLLLGILITDKTLIQSLTAIPLALAFFVPFYYKFWYYPTTPYYLKFIRFATGELTKDDYFATFNRNTPRNYRVARLVNTLTDKQDRIFVWGDSATIYALSKRLPPIKYVADYHINDFADKKGVVQNLSASLPPVIVILNEGEPYPELTSLVSKKYILFTEVDGAQVWKLVNSSLK